MAKNQKLQTVATGLDKLKEAVKGLKLQVPKLRELPDISGLEGTVEGKIQAVHQVQEDVANALKFLDNVKRQIAKHQDRLARKIAISETAGDVAEMKEYLNGALALEDQIYRQAAAIAYLKSVLSGDFKTYEEAAEVLHDLETRGLLVKAGRDGPIMVGFQHYEVSDRFGLDSEDLEEVSGTIGQFSRCLMTLVRQDRQEKTEEVLKVMAKLVNDIVG